MPKFADANTYRNALLTTVGAVALLMSASEANAQETTPPQPAAQSDRVAAMHLPVWGNIDPFYGDINAFWGNINPFWGDINAFWKDINPFYGDINAFYGDINAFYGDINAFYGDINPFWGDINPFERPPVAGEAPPAYDEVGEFWRGIGPLWTETNAQWGALGAYSAGATDYAAVQTKLTQLVTESEALWGQAVTTKTGLSFRAGFADAVFAAHGIDLNDPSTFAGMTAGERSHFFIDWYDGLMDYAGADHVDHWMAAVKWTPQITQIQGAGAGTIIGLLDATVVGDPDIANNITSAAGYTNAVNGHGTSVASLMVAAHDGRGVMGIGPNASVVSYNPFDSDGTASWTDVRAGVIALQAANASVINMSLGIPGWTLNAGWKDALAGVNTTNTLLVVAAGNSGTTQTTNIEWDWTQNAALLVVGAVDGSGNISDFSNRPGSACLLDNGVCATGHNLADRFLVAPGELILVSDGQGGLTRRSGTSFSAPLVSGAITLLHDRWPWLRQYPHETADIILHSARDLGAPGVDQVYGWGMLDVEASQSPLSFSDLTFYEYNNGVMTQKSASEVKAGGMQTTWQADGVFFRLYETIGATHRDFAVPMSSRLVGQKSSVTGSEEYFQTYISARLKGWITGTGSFTDVVTNVAQKPGAWSFAVTQGLPEAPMGHQLTSQAPHMAFRMADPTGKFAFTAGRGQGAMVLGQTDGFNLSRDYNSADGGVNPVLGFASGGPFAGVDFALSNRTTLSVGGAQRELVHRENPVATDYERELLRDVEDYRASALNLRVTHKVTDAFSVNAGFSQLREANGLLGVQSTNDGDLRHGAESRVATVGASLDLPRGVTFAASASAGQTRTAGGGDQSLATVGAVNTSAYAVSFAKQGLFGKHDLFRVAFTQPLTVQSGTLAFTSVEVVDRSTGEIGPVTRTFDISAKPRHVAETLYATPIFSGAGELSLFGRAELQSNEPLQDYMVGARLNLNY